MIMTKDDLKLYLKADKYALERKRDKPSFGDVIWKYEILLRKAEYYFNNRGGGGINYYHFTTDIVKIYLV